MYYNDTASGLAMEKLLKGKSKKQFKNILRLLAPNSRKKDRGHLREKYRKLESDYTKFTKLTFDYIMGQIPGRFRSELMNSPYWGIL